MFVFYLYSQYPCFVRRGLLANSPILTAMIMDLAILMLTVCGLWRKGALRSAIGASLSEQCLWYVVGTFVVTVPAVVSLSNLVSQKTRAELGVQVLPALNLNGKMRLPRDAGGCTR